MPRIQNTGFEYSFGHFLLKLSSFFKPVVNHNAGQSVVSIDSHLNRSGSLPQTVDSGHRALWPFEAITGLISHGHYTGDLRLSGPPSGQGAGSGARTRDRGVPADLRADSQATVLPTPPKRPSIRPGRRWRGLNPRQKDPCRSHGGLANHCATDAPGDKLIYIHSLGKWRQADLPPKLQQQESTRRKRNMMDYRERL
ncbi:hypothetical protein PoB_002200800 [Plakobranchus ocellatus]|uniref:Uncharacterized protein n=1 Tax=Plakobranchus ocellatus TaxID=259542 RepID=A0AAV3ZLP3_9GAST|nr:hypothetical protein PoB_002200800 [Plakobranchus ocellatus]